AKFGPLPAWRNGRRKGLKIPWPTRPSGFESRSGHQYNQGVIGLPSVTRFTGLPELSNQVATEARCFAVSGVFSSRPVRPAFLTIVAADRLRHLACTRVPRAHVGSEGGGAPPPRPPEPALVPLHTPERKLGASGAAVKRSSALGRTMPSPRRRN